MNEHDHGSHHSPNLDTPEHFYEALIDAHRDLAPADSHVLNVRPGEVALMPRGLVQGGLARWPLAPLKYDTANFMTIGSISFDQL